MKPLRGSMGYRVLALLVIAALLSDSSKIAMLVGARAELEAHRRRSVGHWREVADGSLT
jgi:hypothetical protein